MKLFNAFKKKDEPEVKAGTAGEKEGQRVREAGNPHWVRLSEVVSRS